jgi:predicted phage terminase large subunit-like protein
MARRRLIEFTMYTAPWYRPGFVHTFLAEQLESVERGEVRRLMVFMPPRTGKTELLIRWLAWCLGRHPEWPMLYTSYAADLAWDKSGECRGVVASEEFAELFGGRRLVEVKTSPDVALAADSRAVQRWKIAGQRGGLQAAGVGGPITGKGGQVIVIDDPVKNRAEADSATFRQSTWNWYTSTLRTRLEPGGRIVLVMTRWHEDDLAGRLLKLAADNPTADQWHVIKLAGLAKAADPLGRDLGEALDPQRYDRAALLQTKASIGERDWAALYDQEPRQEEGNVFKAAWLSYAETVPVLARSGVVWDTAFESKESSDYSAGVLVGQAEDGMIYVQPLVHDRLEFPELVRAVKAQVARWPTAEQLVEARASGKSLRQQLRFSGLPMIEIEPAGDKVARANSVTRFFESGMVRIVNGPYVDALVHEMLTFPNGAHDDLVDAMVYGLMRLAGYEPVETSENPFYL